MLLFLELCMISLFLTSAGDLAKESKNSPPQTQRLLEWADAAISNTVTVRDDATANLRQLGPNGLHALLARHELEVGRLKRTDAPQGRLLLLRDAISRVARQNDAHHSGLYWYTDYVQAQAAAAANDRPILSLRLLGQLDEELSCANSRLFRTVLYSNRELAEYLRENFVLHWHCVKPVPKITIEFGDGRRLETTITGNSVHYVIDTQGRVVDALPGLYSPKAFKAGLIRAVEVIRQGTPLPEDQRSELLARFHQDRMRLLEKKLLDDLRTSSILGTPSASEAFRERGVLLRRAMATATPVTRESALNNNFSQAGKAGMETSVLFAFNRPYTEPVGIPDVWNQLAVRTMHECRLDEASKLLFQVKHFGAPRDNALAAVDTSAIALTRLEHDLALDTVRNEHTLHYAIHAVLHAAKPVDPEHFDRLVYAKIMATPLSDPWMGLVDPTVYHALSKSGRTEPQETK